MKRILFIVLAIAIAVALPALAPLPAAAQATYYVDAGYTGGSDAGTQPHPWTSLSDTGAWSAVNTSLASGPVTVFFSATQPGSSSAAVTTTAIDLSQRTNTSSNILTLDGQSKKNAGTATVPSWTTNLTLSACIEPVPGDANPPTYVCPQNTNPKFSIQASVPITGPTGSTDFANCVNNFTVQGFSFQSNGGQSANLTYIGNLTFQYNEATRIAVGSNGPGVYIGPGQHGPCHTGSARPAGTDSGPDNVTLNYNLCHDEWGECIYSGASTPDPFSSGSPSCTSSGGSCQQYEGGNYGGTSLNLSCGNGNTSSSSLSLTPGTPATCSTGANYVIHGNTIFGTAAWGGQGDGSDIKDGHTNLSLTDNQYYTTRYPACATGVPACTNLVCYNGTGNSSNGGPGTACTSNTQCTGGGRCGAGSDGRALIIESCSLIDSNFIKAPGHDAIDLGDSWNTSAGRAACQVSNNIVVDVNSGIGHQNGLELETLNVSGLAQWGTVSWLNNTIFNAGNNAGNTGTGILTGAGSASGAVTITNNIFDTTNQAQSIGIGTISYSDCYNNTSGSCTGTGTITTNPQFVSTATPYVAGNFAIQSGSLARAAGANLFSTFTNDYFGDVRPNSAFDIGADQFTSTGQWYVSPTGSDSNPCTSSGSPCLTIAHAESLSSSGDTINLAAGTYRLSTALSSTAGYISAKANQTFVGPSCTPTSAACTAVVSGGVQFTSGQINGPDGFGNYYVTGQTQQGTATQPTSDCDTGWTGCIYPEDLFVNGTPYQHMNLASEATLAASTWWFNYSTHTIYLPSALTPTFVGSNTVETSVLETMFNPNGVNGVTLNNLTVEEFAAPLLLGAIDPNFGTIVSTSSLNWTIENSYITLNHGYGIRCAFGEQVLNNVITVNGDIGTGGGCTTTASIIPSGVVVKGNTITYNNYAQVNPGFGAGGIKYGNTAGVVVRNNIVSHNIGQGIHFDDDSVSPLIDGNTVDYNVDLVSANGEGITFEISTVGATVRNNVVQYNGESSSAGPSYQIDSQTSVGLQAYCNTLETDNSSPAHMQGYVAQASNRGNNAYQPFLNTQLVATGNYFHHNTEIWDSGSTAVTGYSQNDFTHQPNFFANNTAPDYNQYHASSTSLSAFLYNNNSGGNNPTPMTFATYQGTGADTHGTMDTVYTSGFPTVSITSPADQSNFVTNTTITATASDGSGIASAKLYQDWNLISTIAGGGPYSFPVTNVAQGAHVYAVYAIANSGVQSCFAETLTQTAPLATSNTTITNSTITKTKIY